MSEALSLGALVATGMKAKGLDYRALGKLVGVSHGYLWQLVNADKRAVNDPGAKRKRPSEAVARQLASTLELDLQQVLTAAGYGEAEALAPPGPTLYSGYLPPGRQLYQEALAALNKGQASKAAALLEAAIQGGEVALASAHYGLGMAYLQGAKWQHAADQFGLSIESLEGGEAVASPTLADAHFNRGKCWQELARSLPGPEAFQVRLRAQADLWRSISLDGPHPDLYFSALIYLEQERGKFKRALRLGQHFLHRQSVGPTRYTTAALDIHLYMAYAHMALGEVGAGLSLVDLTLHLCPNYWLAHYAKAALLAQVPAHGQAFQAKLASGLAHLRQAIQLNPKAQAHLKAEQLGDFVRWSKEGAFLALLEAPGEARP